MRGLAALVLGLLSAALVCDCSASQRTPGAIAHDADQFCSSWTKVRATKAEIVYGEGEAGAPD